MGKHEIHDIAYICADVYQRIWTHWVTYHAPPDPKAIAAECGLKAWEWRYTLDELRRQGRIHYGSLKPTAYDVWWRHNVAEQ